MFISMDYFTFYFSYHGRDNRGSKSLLLLRLPISEEVLTEDVKVWEVQAHNVSYMLNISYSTKMRIANIVRTKLMNISITSKNEMSNFR